MVCICICISIGVCEQLLQYITLFCGFTPVAVVQLLLTFPLLFYFYINVCMYVLYMGAYVYPYIQYFNMIIVC